MFQENLRLVERAIAAINARDIEGYRACCTEDVTLETAMAAARGVYEGIDYDSRVTASTASARFAQ